MRLLVTTNETKTMKCTENGSSSCEGRDEGEEACRQLHCALSDAVDWKTD